MDHVRTASLPVPNASSGAGEARRFTRSRLAEWGLEDLAEVAALLVSEAVTNALLYTGAAPVLRLCEHDRGLRVEVLDTSPVLPVLRDHGKVATTGRGLHLIDALAVRWGAETVDGGKVVWFEMAADGGAGAGARRTGSRRSGGTSSDGDSGGPASAVVRSSGRSGGAARASGPVPDDRRTR